MILEKLTLPRSFKVNLGPVQPAMDGMGQVVTDIKSLNTRCQRRDLNTAATTLTFTAANLLNLTLGPASATVGSFQDELQGPLGTLRIHGAGHYAVGGDGSDVFTSLNDPSFYLHHAMIDRLYWIWQALHPLEANAISGTITFRNNPPSRDGNVDDLLDMGKLGAHIPIRNVLNTLGGTPLCYIYV
jgi:tyrosinase